MTTAFLPLWLVFGFAGLLGLVGWPYWRPAAALGIGLALVAAAAFLEDIAYVGLLGAGHFVGAIALTASLHVQGWRLRRRREQSKQTPPTNSQPWKP